MPTSLIRLSPYFVFFIVLALALCFSIQSNDLFFYLSLGRIFFKTGHIPTADPFLYTVKNWNIYHEWFAYLTFYISYVIGGFTAVILFKTALWMGVFFLLARQAIRSHVPVTIALSVLTLVGLACSQRFTERGSLFSELFMLILAGVLLPGIPSRRTLMVLPVLFAFWINFHAGFVIGLFIFTVFVVLQGKSATRELWWSLVASYVACLINPDFIVGAIYPLKVALGSDWSLYRQFNPEWMPTFKMPFIITWQVRSLIIVMLCSAAALGTFIYRKRSAPIFLCFLFLLHVYLAQNALRFLSTTSLGFAFLLFYMWPSLGWRLRERWDQIGAGVLAILFVAIGVRICSGHYGSAIHLPEREFGFGVNPTYSPIGAAEFIKANGIPGRIFNQFSWGSYLTWVLDRRDFIYIHGHIDEPKLMVVDFIGTANNKVNFQYAVDKYDIKMVLMQKNVPDVLVEIMKSWKLVYQDDLSALWIR